MTLKGVLRYLISVFLATLLLAIVLPFAQIPRAQMFPPAFVYSNAQGKTTGVVSKKYRVPTSNFFKVGDQINLIDYRFQAPYTPLLLGDPKSNPKKVYTGTVQVGDEAYARFAVNTPVPVRYEKTYPVISGINQAGGGRSTGPGSRLLSGWVLWALLVLALAWMISPLLERVMLRESY